MGAKERARNELIETYENRFDSLLQKVSALCFWRFCSLFVIGWSSQMEQLQTEVDIKREQETQWISEKDELRSRIAELESEVSDCEAQLANVTQNEERLSKESAATAVTTQR